MNILVVDDQEIDRTVLVRILLKLGYTADIATNGLEAIEAIKAKSYQLVFMDIHMQLMDGLSAAEIIFESPPQPPIIIAVTGDTSKKRYCLDLGMADFIEKPFLFNRIKQSINSHV